MGTICTSTARRNTTITSSPNEANVAREQNNQFKNSRLTSRGIAYMYTKVPQSHARTQLQTTTNTNAPLLVVFVHANGFCKGVWTPVMDRLRTRLCLDSTNNNSETKKNSVYMVHMISIDLTGHGDSRSWEDLHFPNEEEGTDNPWESHALDVLSCIDDYIKFHLESSDAQNLSILGVGHSMGAAALLLAELRRPGLFNVGLICAEPIALPHGDDPESIKNETGDMKSIVEQMKSRPQQDGPSFAAKTLKRRIEFASKAEAKNHYKGRGAFKAWSEDALDAFIEDGLRQDDDTGTVKLKCDPEWEYAMYMTRQKLYYKSSSITAPVLLVVGSESMHMSNIPGHPPTTTGYFEQYAKKFSRKLGDGFKIIHGATHFIPMEQPQAIADLVFNVIDASHGTKGNHTTATDASAGAGAGASVAGLHDVHDSKL